MAPSHSDDDDTREHPAQPRYPDAAPGPDEAAEQPSATETRAADDASPSARPWSSAPTAQWPQPTAGAPGSGQAAGQVPPAQQPTQAWDAPAGQTPPSQPPRQDWQQPAQRPWESPPGQSPAGPGAQPPAAGWQGQPPPGGWQQPNQWVQPAAWAGPAEYRGPEYATSAMVVIAGIILIVYGLFTTLIGGLGVAIGGFVEQVLREARQEDLEGLEGLEGVDLSGIGDILVVLFAFVLVIGILHLVSAIGLFLHKGWARIIAIVLSVLGTLFGVLSLVGASNMAGALDGSEWIVPIVMTAGYAFCLFALIAGGSHFRRRYPR